MFRNLTVILPQRRYKDTIKRRNDYNSFNVHMGL